VPIFIGRDATLRDRLLTPKLAVLPMRAVELHPLAARLTLTMYCHDELNALSP
jgi:hypothetical protein